MKDFESMHLDLLDALTENGKVVNISKKFGSDKNSTDMLNSLWNLEEFHKYVEVQKLISPKNNEFSNTMRKFGNNYFKKNMLEQALACFDKSIINALHPARNEEQSSSQSLAIAYANRSAVLYLRKQYDHCLSDIKRAFQYGYPIDLHEKIIKREIKCKFDKSNIDAAKEAYESYINDKKYNGNKKLIGDLKKLISELSKTKKSVLKSEVESIKKIIYFENNMIKDVNKIYPSASDAIDFHCNEKGRGFIAKRDIMPGQVIMKEKAYAAVLLDKCLLSHCLHCLKKVKYAPVPCHTCTNVIFCDEICRTKADDSFHKVECLLLSTFLKLDMGKNSSITLRILCKVGLKEVLKQFRVYKEFPDIVQSNIGLNNEGIYKADNLQTVFHLVTNKHLRSVGDLFKRCSLTLTLLKLFVGEPMYCEDVPEITDLNLSTLTETQHNLASAILILSMNLPSNAHSIGEQVSGTPGFNYVQLVDVGSGVFSTFSLLNHACNPNVTRITHRHELIGLATQVIKAGTEIYDSYGPCYTSEPIIRRETLVSQYYFDCNCIACNENWPMYKEMTKELKMKCPSCGVMIDFTNQRCSICEKSINDLKSLIEDEYADFKMVIKKKAQLQHEFFKICRNVGNSPLTDDDIKLLIKVIIFMSKYCITPSSMVVEAQEYLKQGMDCYLLSLSK